MKTNRRQFLKTAGAAGAGLTALGMTGIKPGRKAGRAELFAYTKREAEETHQQIFNMCGYAAPRLETVRIGLIGVGSRGFAAVGRLRLIEGVEIRALCDKYQDRVDLGQKSLRKNKETLHDVGKLLL